MGLRKVCLVLQICILACFISGCAGIGDWTSEPLPGNFVVIRSNSQQVQLYIPDEDDTGGTPVVGPVITKIAWNEDYIFLKVKEPEDSIEHLNDLKKLFKRDYYIVEADSKEVLGPLSKKAFKKTLEEKQITQVEWQGVNSLPRMEEN